MKNRLDICLYCGHIRAAHEAYTGMCVHNPLFYGNGCQDRSDDDCTCKRFRKLLNVNENINRIL